MAAGWVGIDLRGVVGNSKKQEASVKLYTKREVERILREQGKKFNSVVIDGGWYWSLKIDFGDVEAVRKIGLFGQDFSPDCVVELVNG